MKVVFLDIDGVLNNIRWVEESYEQPNLRGFGVPTYPVEKENINWDPSNVSCLDNLLRESKAKVVISSTWRIGNKISFFEECFSLYGLPPVVMGMTPRLQEIGSIRGDEVASWVGVNKPDIWVCLDDDGDFHPYNRLIQTNMNQGLTDEEVEKAIKLLG